MNIQLAIAVFIALLLAGCATSEPDPGNPFPEQEKPIILD